VKALEGVVAPSLPDSYDRVKKALALFIPRDRAFRGKHGRSVKQARRFFDVVFFLFESKRWTCSSAGIERFNVDSFGSHRNYRGSVSPRRALDALVAFGLVTKEDAESFAEWGRKRRVHVERAEELHTLRYKVKHYNFTNAEIFGARNSEDE
jgi:hypothetical protein